MPHQGRHATPPVPPLSGADAASDPAARGAGPSDHRSALQREASSADRDLIGPAAAGSAPEEVHAQGLHGLVPDDDVLLDDGRLLAGHVASALCSLPARPTLVHLAALRFTDLHLLLQTNGMGRPNDATKKSMSEQLCHWLSEDPARSLALPGGLRRTASTERAVDEQHNQDPQRPGVPLPPPTINTTDGHPPAHAHADADGAGRRSDGLMSDIASARSGARRPRRKRGGRKHRQRRPDQAPPSEPVVDHQLPPLFQCLADVPPTLATVVSTLSGALEFARKVQQGTVASGDGARQVTAITPLLSQVRALASGMGLERLRDAANAVDVLAGRGRPSLETHVASGTVGRTP